MSQILSDKEFILNSDNWPSWPHLPMKRGESPNQELGVMVAGNPQTIFLINLYEINPETFKTCKSIIYTSIDDLLADGWMID